eukprot:6196518-Pleurochrysis_carterae.AAC.1
MELTYTMSRSRALPAHLLRRSVSAYAVSRVSWRRGGVLRTHGVAHECMHGARRRRHHCREGRVRVVYGVGAGNGEEP